MFSLRADDEVWLELGEEHHAQLSFDLVDRNREHLRPWMPWVDATKTVDDSLAYLKSVRIAYAEGREVHTYLRYRGEVVGAMGLRVDRQHLTADLGYWVDEGHQGRGIVTRATRALTGAAFTDLGLVRVAIRAAVDNVRSRAVPERLGFTFEGVLRSNEKVGDRHVDHAVYSMLADEWRTA